MSLAMASSSSRAHARVALEKQVHLVFIAGENHHQIVAVVFHYLQQDLDRLGAVVALVFGLVQVIGFVDEQHAAHGLLDHFLGLGRGVPDVLADQIVARHGHQMPLAHVAEAFQYLAHAHRHRGLAGTGVAGEAHVQRRGLRRERKLLAQAIDQQQGRDLADAGLDRNQSDQFAVELVEHFLDVGRLEFGLQIHLVGVGDNVGLRLAHGSLPSAVMKKPGGAAGRTARVWLSLFQ
jgi:hypothetical protein